MKTRYSSSLLPLPGRPSGFALVVTLVLMVLLSILAVGMLSLSQVSLRSAGASEQFQTARQNARMGMLIALAELQVNLGPDSRSSFRSDLLSDSPASPHVLGVVSTRSTTPSSGDPAALLETLRTEGRANPEWLVSSERELNALTDSPSASSTETIAIQSFNSVSGTKENILAGKIMLNSSNNTANPEGAYAWWVDDESQKASINITSPDQLASGLNFEEHWKLTPSQQTPLNQVDTDPTLAGYSPTEVSGYDPDDRETIRKLVGLPTADLAYSVAGNEKWFQDNQLDFTASSKGLPIDVTEGRLKQDLSYYVETGNGLGDDDPVIRGSNADEDYTGAAFSGLDYSSEDMPRMGRIRSWKEIGESVTGFDNGGTASRPKTRSDHGVHPVIARAGIYYAPYYDESVRRVFRADSGARPAQGGDPAVQGWQLDIRLAAYPRVTIWNPTSVPITDPYFIYQVGVTNHFMLYAKSEGSDAGSASAGAAIDNANLLWWRTFEPTDNRKMMFFNMMNTLNPLHQIEQTMPFITFALRLDSPLMPGQTRTFYPATSEQILIPHQEGDFNSLSTGNLDSANLMVASPAPNNYFKLSFADGREWSRPVFAVDRDRRDADGNFMPPENQPGVPESLDTYLFMRHAESGPNFRGNWTYGASYRLWKANNSAPPELLQEIFAAEHKGGASGEATNGFPPYSISNAQLYDDPDDGVEATGQSLVKAYADPNRDSTSRRGHQLFLSYATEDPRSDYSSLYSDSSRQFLPFKHYNPRSRYIFPGSYEEQELPGGDAFDTAAQGERQDIYSEGRPEAAWINDWPVDSFSSEGGSEGGSEFGTASLYDLNLNSNGLVYPLYDFPRAQDGILSLGDLQAVDFATYPWQPGNAFGNSNADPRIGRDSYFENISDDEDHFHIQSLNLGQNRYIDLSWLINQSMWDRFFVSTIPYGSSDSNASAGDSLRNARHEIVNHAGQSEIDPATAFEEAAAQIRVAGAFNVNSTSVAAWKQFLSSNMDLSVDAQIGGRSTPEDQASFPRLLYPYREEPAQGARDVGGIEENRAAFSANRSLTAEELHLLAVKIVEEVKQRGPFLSIADFVNRRLVEGGDTRYGEWAGLSGTLQTAIDRVTVEDESINQHLLAEPDLRFTRDDVSDYLEVDHVVGLPAGVEQSRLAGAPGSLTQADILRSVGPLLTVRGDTFRIRAYGEARNANTGNIEARAWCEAIVQRDVAPVDSGDDFIRPDENTYPFGRGFKVVSFRWLAEDEV